MTTLASRRIASLTAAIAKAHNPVVVRALAMRRRFWLNALEAA